MPTTDKGLPIPFVAAWSSERWASARIDTCLPMGAQWALFGAGQHGLGRPLLGVLNEERQRFVSMNRLCQVCTRPYGSNGWCAVIAPRDTRTQDGEHRITSYEPPACEPCMDWALHNCPGLRKDEHHRANPWSAVYPEHYFDRVLEIVDAAAAPPLQDHLFDGSDDLALRQRLASIGKLHGVNGGLIGYVGFALPIGTELAEREGQ